MAVHPPAWTKPNRQKFFASFFQKRKEREDSSFLKKRSKKLLSIWFLACISLRFHPGKACWV
jgi:hypothetical protein